MKPTFESEDSEAEHEIQWVGVGNKFDDDSAVEWEVVYDNPLYCEHRWYSEGFLVVSSAEGEVWGHMYMRDASESQDGQFSYNEYWLGCQEEYEWVPVKSKTVTVYDPA